MKISFVIPCYRSENTISTVVEEIVNKMEEMSHKDYEIILVNDCSPDDTYTKIRLLCSENTRIKGVELAKNFGQHAALMAGFQLVTGDVIVCPDDDGQTPANEVDKLLCKIEEGYDVVYAKYETKHHSSFRNFGSSVNKKMTELMLGKPKELYVSSYFASKRYIIDEIIRYQNAYPYVIGLILRTTKNICNVTVNHRDRLEGTSGYSLKKLFALWINGFTSFSVLPLRFATIGGFSIAFIGFIYAVYVIVRRIIDPMRAIGWSSTMAALMLIGGLILVVLGIMGEYVGRIYISINNSPQYVIRSIINIESGEKNE